MARIGRVASLNINPESGIPKIRHEDGVIVEKHGFGGDFHNREQRPSFKDPSIIKPNMWHVSIMASEVYCSLNCDPRLEKLPHLPYGALGENVTVSGLGDLSDVPDGAEIVLDDWVWLRKVEHMEPCKVIAALDKRIGKFLMENGTNRRGIYCEILTGVGHRLVAGTKVEIL